MTLPTSEPLPGLEPLRMPDIRRPERMPSWPEWVASRIAALTIEMQPDPHSRKWREAPTLPGRMMLRGDERRMIEHHVHDLQQVCDRTPANDPESEQALLVAVTKMMLVLPAAHQNETSAEARGEAYLGALEDLPVWAVQAAIRRWMRGDAGQDSRGAAYDYRWCPAPADLRRIAFAETWRVRRRALDLQQLLGAEPRREFRAGHRRAMGEKLRALGLDYSPVGQDGSGEGAGG